MRTCTHLSIHVCVLSHIRHIFFYSYIRYQYSVLLCHLTGPHGPFLIKGYVPPSLHIVFPYLSSSRCIPLYIYPLLYINVLRDMPLLRLTNISLYSFLHIICIYLYILLIITHSYKEIYLPYLYYISILTPLKRIFMPVRFV